MLGLKVKEGLFVYGEPEKRFPPVGMDAELIKNGMLWFV